MALILNIETATQICSVAVVRDGIIECLKENNEGQSHARLLTILISECLLEAKVKFSELDAIAVSKGPGSFTGLRIGVATAKGLCYALDKPLISVNTLQSMAATFLQKNKIESDTLLCPMIDARRMEVYTGFFNFKLEFVRETTADIIDNQSFDVLLSQHKVIFFGDGAEKTKIHLKRWDSALFFDDFEASASGMVQFSEKSYIEKGFESVAYFEPFYLKDFYTPKQPL